MMPFALDAVVTSLGTHSLSVSRPGGDTFDSHGRALPRTTVATFTVIAVAYPEGAKLDRKSGTGYNTGSRIHILATTSLRERDLVTYTDGVYEVDTVLGWEPSGNFCEASALRRDAPYEPR